MSKGLIRGVIQTLRKGGLICGGAYTRGGGGLTGGEIRYKVCAYPLNVFFPNLELPSEFLFPSSTDIFCNFFEENEKTFCRNYIFS